jgi:hypothetical protein
MEMNSVQTLESPPPLGVRFQFTQQGNPCGPGVILDQKTSQDHWGEVVHHVSKVLEVEMDGWLESPK